MNGEKLVQNIKAIAVAKGIKMEYLYTAGKVTSGALSQWKSGETKPRVATLSRIADTLGVSMSDLMEGTDSIKETPATEDMAEVLQAFRERPEMKMLFDAGLKANPETVRETARFLEGLAGVGKTD